jgi:predicted component of type VI protein secretion system
MKLSLEVLTPGKSQGQGIPVTLSQFLIGRDAQCQLRPASALISNRHCAVLIKDNKVFVRDFDSTNGTFVNDEPVKGEREVRDQDQLKVGPLLFKVRVQSGAPARAGTGAVPVSKPTPPPPTKTASSDEEDIAAILLSVGDDGGLNVPTGPDGVPTGSTVMDIPAPISAGEPGADGGKPAGKPPKKVAENTSVAAKAILDKYMRRPRG